MYHTRSFLNSLSEAYSGRVHNFTSQQSYISEETQGSPVWGETPDGKPYQRWSPGYVDSEKKQEPVPYDYQRSQLVSAIFGYKTNQKKSKTEADMLHRVESAMIRKGEALVESFTPDHAAEILTNYLFNQGLNPNPALVGEFVDLIEMSTNELYKLPRKEFMSHISQYPETTQKTMINIYNSHNAPGPGDRKRAQENQPRRIQPTNTKMREPMGAKSRREKKAFTDTPRKKQEAETTRTVVAPTSSVSGEGESGNAKDPLEAKRERLIRRGRELDAKTIRTVARGFSRHLKQSLKNTRGTTKAVGGDIQPGRGTSYRSRG